jgi:hypothetical protein
VEEAKPRARQHARSVSGRRLWQRQSASATSHRGSRAPAWSHGHLVTLVEVRLRSSNKKRRRRSRPIPAGVASATTRVRRVGASEHGHERQIEKERLQGNIGVEKYRAAVAPELAGGKPGAAAARWPHQV